MNHNQSVHIKSEYVYIHLYIYQAHKNMLKHFYVLEKLLRKGHNSELSLWFRAHNIVCTESVCGYGLVLL